MKYCLIVLSLLAFSQPVLAGPGHDHGESAFAGGTGAATHFDLTDQQIENYLLKEKPYNCAGSFKSEGLGVALFARQEGEDPTSLIGLPLIRLVSMLNNEGYQVL